MRDTSPDNRYLSTRLDRAVNCATGAERLRFHDLDTGNQAAATVSRSGDVVTLRLSLIDDLDVAASMSNEKARELVGTIHEIVGLPDDGLIETKAATTLPFRDAQTGDDALSLVRRVNHRIVIGLSLSGTTETSRSS